MSAGNPDGPRDELVRHNLPPQPREPSELFVDQPPYDGLGLDRRDPIENALADLVNLYRLRRPGMVIDGNPYAKYEHSARNLDIPYFGAPEALLHLIQQEQANINGMRRSGRLFQMDNDEALGSYMEMAFHAAILYSWMKGYMRR